MRICYHTPGGGFTGSLFWELLPPLVPAGASPVYKQQWQWIPVHLHCDGWLQINIQVV